MRIGILFGGPSREREISFAGGRTVYDNLNKALFTPVPIFIDSFHNLILLDWQFIYKGSIRDFYPPIEHIGDLAIQFQPYIENLEGIYASKEIEKAIEKIGKRISLNDLHNYIDFAFLALHGRFGEDGTIQALLEHQGIPYSGSGIAASAIGMNKSIQKKMMAEMGFACPSFLSISRPIWLEGIAIDDIFDSIKSNIGFPLVIRPANQGSSIGVSIVQEAAQDELMQAIDRAFFVKRIAHDQWTSMSESEKANELKQWTDIRQDIGMPILVGDKKLFNPDQVLAYINDFFRSNKKTLHLQAEDGEFEVIAESFIHGKEFSCIVIKNENGEPVALPPTEIIKGKEVFDYRSKYLAGLSRKVTPIDLPPHQVEEIRDACSRLFKLLDFHVYARIDGFINEKGIIYLNDPNTTSGMLPSSFFFHQAAEIGLNPSQFLTYIIRTSLWERINHTTLHSHWGNILKSIDSGIAKLHRLEAECKKVAIILGGYSSERHISVESGRNIYEKLSASENYEPIPVFLTGSPEKFRLYQIPVNMLLKDNADDIAQKISSYSKHEVVDKIRQEAAEVTTKYAFTDYHFEQVELTIGQLCNLADFVFIALHGRPGEDGELQKELEKFNMPYNGSGTMSSAITINKYETNKLLSSHGFQVAEQVLVHQDEWQKNRDSTISQIEEKLPYPFIAKPMDDGCSSAVKKISNQDDLNAYAAAIFRETPTIGPDISNQLKLKPKEEFPIKKQFLLECLISKEDADTFLEITGGMLIDPGKDNDRFEIFEPSETLAGEEVLSLEEKFLAGQGQNITPARLGSSKAEYNRISAIVKAELKRAALVLGVEGYCRIDAFVRVFNDGRVETIIIEINSLPGLTPATCIFHQAAINGYKPFDFLNRIIEFGFERNKVKIC